MIDIIKKNLRNLNSTSLGKKVCDNLMKKYREFLIGGGFSSNTNITTNSYKILNVLVWHVKALSTVFCT